MTKCHIFWLTAPFLWGIVIFMMKQEKIAKILGVTQSLISKIETGSRPLSYPLAIKLFKMLPEKDVEAWKHSSPEEIEAAFKKIVTTQNTYPNQIDLGEIDAL